MLTLLVSGNKLCKVREIMLQIWISLSRVRRILGPRILKTTRIEKVKKLQRKEVRQRDLVR